MVPARPAAYYPRCQGALHSVAGIYHIPLIPEAGATRVLERKAVQPLSDRCPGLTRWIANRLGYWSAPLRLVGAQL
jgi:hypothetical protein